MADVEITTTPSTTGASAVRRKSVRWKIAETHPELEADISAHFGLSPLVSRLLAARGVQSVRDAAQFLKPSRDHLHSPFLFRDMEKAVARIQQAIDRREKIFIFGDRDVDGVCATVTMLTVLRAFGAEVDWHIPAGGEGYGIHADTMTRALSEKFTLGIAVDTGISEIERVQQAKDGGMDMIIADHHEPKEVLPDAYAILHTDTEGETYPYKHLSGAGVAFKIAMALFAARSPYHGRTLVFADIETTGLSRTDDEIIEIAAVKYRNGVRLGDFGVLVKPGRQLDDEVRALTGLTDGELDAKGISIRDALRKFLEFISGPDTTLMVYNASFDCVFIDAALQKHMATKLQVPVEDVLAAARRATPGASHKLAMMAERLGVSQSSYHRALADAQATADIFSKLMEQQEIEGRVFYERLIQLAALACVADMMPLTGENRAIVAEGLSWMRRAPMLGIKHLFTHLDVSLPTARDIAFLAAPALNAPGRLGDATPAVRLLMAASGAEATKWSEELIRMNTERKDLGKDNFQRILEMVPRQNNMDTDPILCVAAENVPHGVTGIVATRIKNDTGRPVMIILIEDGKGVGTGRSVRGLSLMDAVTECGDVLEKFGGHEQAVGVTVSPANIPVFFERLKAAVGRRVKDLPEATLDIDAELSVGDLKLPILDELAVLEPCGKANPAPRFAVFGAPLAEARTMGDDQRHLRVRIGEHARASVTGVFWGQGALADKLTRRVDAAFELSRNEWNNRVELRLDLQDLRPAEGEKSR